MKSILAVQWINDYCSQAKYIVKADDDIFLNIFAAIEYLVSQIYEKDYAIMCHLKEADTSPIMRDPKSKWYVPKEVFEGRKHYPRFCSGYAVIFTANLVPFLYKASFDAPYFAVDDAYLFGLLLGKVPDVNYISIQDYMTLNQNSALEEYEGTGPLVHVASAAWEEGAMAKFWAKTLSKLTSWAKQHAKITNKKALDRKK
ncbi:hypothetical protein KUTeg_024781 [Tegillarca granosa]|uniref:Hexosyltransferase n=1 Tax=Tegillarca granosa TaxID=220873 RepID=A0ABQ9DZC3_TEGGR|nr:hypothetical protein KUTeg_024781 [Tegillarca granosa]